jgi:predicted  nucleic acid-binding Zn-ribbon protein
VGPSDLKPPEGLAQHPNDDAIDQDSQQDLDADSAPLPASLTLLTQGARWPEAMAGLGEAVSLETVAEQAETWSDDNAPALLLGYTDPVHALYNQAAGLTVESDPLTLLESWLSCTARFLEWKRRWPDQVRLVHLRPPVEEASAQTPENLDPRLLAVLHALPQLAERHADLEACADLEGQEPMFNLGLPPLRSGAFASLCLESWRRDQQVQLDLQRQSAGQLEGLSGKLAELRSDLEDTRTQLELTRGQLEATRTAFDITRDERDGLRDERDALRDERDGLRDERDGLRDERDALRDERDDREQELLSLREAEAATASAAERRTQELEQVLQHTQAASEVTLAQLHAVQDTMEQLYGERRRIEDALQKIGAEREHLGNEAASLRQELEALQTEVAHYLRASSPGPQLDRSRIPRLTALLRDALQLH